MALVPMTLADAKRLCDRLDRRLGLDREAWSRLVARSMPQVEATRRFIDPDLSSHRLMQDLWTRLRPPHAPQCTAALPSAPPTGMNV